MINKWQEELDTVSRPEKVKILSSFFKCGKGEYGEGDCFVGITVPDNRRISERYYMLPFDSLSLMLNSDVHEYRLAALLALVKRYAKTKTPDERDTIVDFYLANTSHINNWDLVDLSAPKILGRHLLTLPSPTLLDRLAESDSLWEQRIAVVSTYTLIKGGRYDDTLRIAKRFLSHRHDLIHKAVGWMLREVGKMDIDILAGFLDKHATEMPRTMLRYAIEKMPQERRRHYMNLRK